MKYLLFLFLAVYPLAVAASGNLDQEGKELVEQAERRTNIFELPSFEMRASIRMDNSGSPIEGTFLLLWNGPDQWREEISLPGYSEVTVGGKNTISLKRSTHFIPLQVDQLHAALRYPISYGSLTSWPNEKVKKIRDEKVNGAKVRCIEIGDRENHHREVCVDASTGVIVRQLPFLDRDMTPIGAKLFPHFLSYSEDGKVLAQVQVNDLKTTDRLPPSAFTPPPGAVVRAGCINPSPARLVNRVHPQYPEAARQSLVQGQVGIYALMATDGILRDLQVVSGPSPELNKAALDAVQNWRYEPATCDGTAIESEIVITINFTLH